MDQAADMTARLVSEKKAHSPMKGLLDTSYFLKPMLKKDYQLLKGMTISHVSLAYREKDDKFFVIADAGMNIAPNINQKKDIIANSVELANALGIENPIVVPLTAKEKAYDKMPATLEAEELHQMNLRGEIPHCRVSGPLQLDLAVSEHSAQVKGCKDPLAGKAQILLVPDIEAGNIFAKALTYLGEFVGYGIVLGAKVPMIVVSRADGEDEKLGSMYLARLIFEKEKQHV
jgi:phosphate butyryltransferase